MYCLYAYIIEQRRANVNIPGQERLNYVIIIVPHNLQSMPNENVDVSVVLPILRQIPLFANLDEEMLKEIIENIVLMYYPPEYMIFKEGDEGDALYIMKKGQVEIFHSPREAGELPKKIAEIDATGFFGEMALVSDQPRNASAKTLLESEIFILSKEAFQKLLNSNQTLAEQISATMVSRLNANDKENQ